MVPSSMTKEQTMSPLRARMIEDMKLAGLAATTQEIYLQAVRSLAKHYNRSPELLAEEEVRRYLLDVRERNARGSGRGVPESFTVGAPQPTERRRAPDLS